MIAAGKICEQPGAPQTFNDELNCLHRAMKIYNIRYHLAIFPKDLVRSWWNQAGDMPEPTSGLAYLAYKAGLAPRRRLCKGRHWRQLRIIEGGRSEAGDALATGGYGVGLEG
jgi:hypothetical protein